MTDAAALTDVVDAPTASAPADAAPDAPDVSALQRELSEARKEAAKTRTELNKLRDASKTADDQKLSDLEKAAKRIAEMEGEITKRDAAARQQALSTAAVSAAARQGWADVDDAARYIDESEVEWSDDGRPKNVAALLSDVLKAKPWLRASFTRTPDLGQGARGSSTLTKEQVRALAKEKPDEFNARWEKGEFADVMGARG